MRISKKCEYALKAVLELAFRDTVRPVKIHDIAGAQNIPARFLEAILNELRHGGFVESRRGSEGGYMLAQGADEITVGAIIRFIHGPIFGTAENAEQNRNALPLLGDHSFGQLWAKVNRVVSEVCDNTTFAELAESEKNKKRMFVTDYAI